MKMKQLIKIINVITNRATPYDICELLEQDYYSKSRQENIKYVIWIYFISLEYL